MSDTLFEVIYIDKFTDVAEASVIRERIKAKFKLSERVMESLSTGLPIVVKKNVEIEEAERFDTAIKEAGGVCWVQPMSIDQKFHDRRDDQRRQRNDRRVRYRGSSILPDRRAGVGRRSDDNMT